MVQQLEAGISDWIQNEDMKAVIFDEDIRSRLIPFVPRWPLMIHCMVGIFMLGASAYYHNFYEESEWHKLYLDKLDFSGIAVMIVGSGVPPIFYAFNCQEN